MNFILLIPFFIKAVIASVQFHILETFCL